MTGWSFVIAAYTIVAVTTLALVVGSLRAMRRAESDAAKPRK